MTRTKGPDEVFCTSCGEAIKEQAVICPSCGVKNSKGGTTTSPDPDEVSEVWYYGVLAATAMWVVGLLVSDVASSVSGFMYLIAWPLLPISVYYDHKWVEANTDWNPETAGWIPGALFPIVNIPVMVAYLFFRWNANEITVSKQTRQPPADPVDRLQQQYRNGEISHAELERRLDEEMDDRDSDSETQTTWTEERN